MLLIDTHSWGGPVGMPRDWMPMTEFDPVTRIGTARGYTGQGVSTTNLMGRVLAEGRLESITVLSPACSNTCAPFCTYRRKPWSWVMTMHDWFSEATASTGHLRNDSGLDE